MLAHARPRRTTETRTDAALQAEARDAEIVGAAAMTEEGAVPPGFVHYAPTDKHLHPDDPKTWGKVPRNAPCPCGSGKKYKHCHGRY